MNDICRKLGQTDQDPQEWLILTSPDSRVLPDVESFPRPAKRQDGSYIYEKIPSAGDDDDVSVIGTAASGSVGVNRDLSYFVTLDLFYSEFMDEVEVKTFIQTLLFYSTIISSAPFLSFLSTIKF